MNIKGMNKASILAALYNSSKPQGMGFLHAKHGDMSDAEAQKLLDDGHSYFDYLYGRVMKINLSGDFLETRLYDRDNGAGAAERALAHLVNGKVNDMSAPDCDDA